MPVYLNERQVGFDTSVVGFPDLGDCIAVVVQEAGGLYGFHMMPGDLDRIAGFIAYYTNRLGLATANWVHLYGTCYFPNRYANDGASGWKKEMNGIAQAIGYQGQVSGFDTSEESIKIERTESTYVEFRKQSGANCSIHFKRMKKMTVATAGPAIPAGVDNIRHVEKQSGGTYGLGTTRGFKLATSASVNRTRWNKGEIHEVPAHKLQSYTYP